MQKVKSGVRAVKNSPVERRKSFNKIIKIAMIRKGIETQEDLTVLLGMHSRSSLSKRMTGMVPWTFDELCNLFRVLELSPQEAAEAMNVIAPG